MKPSLLALIFVPFLLLACESARAQVRDISQPDFVANPPANALILDVRSAEEFTAGHVPKAKLIPHDELAERITELEAAKDAPIVVYCESGRRAGMAGDVLLEAGFTNVLHLDGDIRGWRESNLPIEK